VQLITNTMLKPEHRGARGSRRASCSRREGAPRQGQEIYAQVCFACHGEDGRGAKVPGAQTEALLGPPLASSPRVLGHQDYVVKTVLHGLTGPLDGTTYPDVMIGMGQNSD
jgi:mono/diheme cytochrome c family protein